MSQSPTEIIKLHTEELLKLLGVETEVTVTESEAEDRNYLEVDVKSEEHSAELIGHHGNMLEALTVVLGMFVPRTEQRYNVILDINGYRCERAKYIQEVADRACAEALATGRDVVLEPMKPWERRVVHMSVVGRKDIVTESIGMGEERKVAIKPAA